MGNSRVVAMSSVELSPGPVYLPHDPRATWAGDHNHAQGRGTFGTRPTDLVDPLRFALSGSYKSQTADSPGPAYKPSNPKAQWCAPRGSPQRGPSFTSAPRFTEELGTHFQCPHRMRPQSAASERRSLDAALDLLSVIDTPHPTVAKFIAAQKHAHVEDELSQLDGWLKKQRGQINQPPPAIRKCIAVLARLDTNQLVHLSLSERNLVRAARRMKLKAKNASVKTPGPGHHEVYELSQTDSIAASIGFRRGPRFSVRERTRPEPIFIEAVGSARDGPGPAHQLLRHSEQGVLFGPSMVCDSRMAVDNKMSMVAASLGHYQAR